MFIDQSMTTGREGCVEPTPDETGSRTTEEPEDGNVPPRMETGEFGGLGSRMTEGGPGTASRMVDDAVPGYVTFPPAGAPSVPAVVPAGGLPIVTL
jgi:hypothetical protein